MLATLSIPKCNLESDNNINDVIYGLAADLPNIEDITKLTNDKIGEINLQVILIVSIP